MAALTEISPVQIVRGGAKLTAYNDTADSDPIVLTVNQHIEIPNDGNVFLLVRRTGTEAANMVVHTFTEIDGLALPNRTIALSTISGDIHVYGPFLTDTYSNDDGDMIVEFSAVDSIEFSVFRG